MLYSLTILSIDPEPAVGQLWTWHRCHKAKTINLWGMNPYAMSNHIVAKVIYLAQVMQSNGCWSVKMRKCSTYNWDLVQALKSTSPALARHQPHSLILYVYTINQEEINSEKRSNPQQIILYCC